MNIGIEDLTKIRSIIDEYRELYSQYDIIVKELTTLANKLSNMESNRADLKIRLDDLRSQEEILLGQLRSKEDFNQEEFQKLLFSI